MKLKTIKKLKIFILISLVLLFILSIVLGALQKNWIAVLISVVGLFSSLLPSILERKFSVDFSEGVEIIALLFIYAYFYLGEYHNFFSLFWWWDLFLHGVGLFLIGLMSFSIVALLNKKRNVAVNLSAFFVAVFAFCFALSIGALWEIFEFFMDSFFGFNMQKSGLVDTMGDMIMGSFGAFVASCLGYIYMRRNSLGFYTFFRDLIKKSS